VGVCAFEGCGYCNRAKETWINFEPIPDLTTANEVRERARDYVSRTENKTLTAKQLGDVQQELHVKGDRFKAKFCFIASSQLQNLKTFLSLFPVAP